MFLVNAYVMVDWQGILILLFLESVVKGVDFDNITTMITNFINIYGGFDDKKNMRANIVVFLLGDKVAVFHIVCNGFTVQLQQMTYSFMVGMYCMAHRMNLVV